MPSLKDLFKKKRSNDGSPQSDELTPEDIAGLSDDEFNDYMSGAAGGFDDEEPEVENVVEDEEENPSTASGPPPLRQGRPDEEGLENVEDDDEDLTTESGTTPLSQGSLDEEVPENGDNEKINRVIELAGELYAGEADPLTMLADDIEAQLAESDGLSVDDYRSKKDADREAKRIDERDGIIKRWNDDSASMKHIDSEFEFMKAMQNDTFKDAILSGKTVFEAYAAMRDAKPEEEPQKTEREPIDQNIQVSGGGTGTGSKNPADLSDKDFKKYIEKQRSL